MPGIASAQGTCEEEKAAQDTFQCDECPAHQACTYPPPLTADPWGCWQTFDWTCQIVSGALTNPELSHAALIPTGTYQGKVLLWHNGGPGSNNDTTHTFLFDPAGPHRLLVSEQVLQSNLFCSGASWSPRGLLIAVGGGREAIPSYKAPVETYVFYPTFLGDVLPLQPQFPCTAKVIEGNPWVQVGDMHLLRYYPTLFTLLRGAIHSTIAGAGLTGGSPFVLGGEWNGNVYGYGNDWYELLNLQSGVWSHVFRAESGGIGCDNDPSDLTLPDCPPVEEHYELHHDPAEPPPDPILEYYPRALQLATTDDDLEPTRKNVFVANDTEIETETGCSTMTHPYCNAPGSSWVIKLPYDGAQIPWQLWTGPFDDLAENGGLATERFYTPVVLRHDLDQKNRVIALGGQYVVSATGENDIRRDVVELTPDASNPDIYKATWDKKHDLITPRYFCNAVILPTGRVLIIGGAQDLCIDCDGPDRLPIPACCPELYEPGDTAAGIVPTSWLLAARPNDPANGTFSYSRLYHNVALALADGRVLNAGGLNALRCNSNDTDYPESEFTGDLFAPPYFHDPTRPLVTLDSASQVDFEGGTNDSIEVTVTYPDGYDPDRQIDRFVLLRPGAVTHHFDNDQRYIELAFTASAPNGNQQAYTIDAPADDLGPPGFYMLFATRPTGANPPLDRVPSKAAVFLRFK